MKRYLISKVVTAQTMPYREACSQYSRVGTLAKDMPEDAHGFIVCHTHPLLFEWVPESEFSGIPFDSGHDILMHYSEAFEEISEFFKVYSKTVTKEQRTIIYTINRHLKGINKNVKRLLDK